MKQEEKTKTRIRAGTKMNRLLRVGISVGLGFGAMLGFIALMTFISHNGAI